MAADRQHEQAASIDRCGKRRGEDICTCGWPELSCTFGVPGELLAGGGVVDPDTVQRVLGTLSESSAAQDRCGNTIHSDYVSDHRCQLPRGHGGDCLFGAPAWALLREFEDLPVRRSTGYTVVMERGPLDAWRARCGGLR